MTFVSVFHGCVRSSVHCIWNCALADAVQFIVVPLPDALMPLITNAGNPEPGALP